MTQLLRIEWLKLKHYGTFWIMTLLFTVLLTVFYLSIGLGWINIGAGGISIFSKAGSFSGIWDDLCFFASYFVIALAILMAIITTNEYQYRTNRQNVIDGWTRMQCYHVKWQLVFALSIGTTLFTFLLGALSGLLSGLPLSTLFDNSEKLFYLFILCLNYLGFALLLSLLFRRSGLTIGILMFYSMMLEMILHALFLFKYKFPPGDLFLPLQCSDELLPSNPSRMLKMTLRSEINPGNWVYVTVTIAWLLVYYFAGRARLAKSDW